MLAIKMIIIVPQSQITRVPVSHKIAKIVIIRIFGYRGPLIMTLNIFPLIPENTAGYGQDAAAAPVMEQGAIRTIRIGGCIAAFTATNIT